MRKKKKSGRTKGGDYYIEDRPEERNKRGYWGNDARKRKRPAAKKEPGVGARPGHHSSTSEKRPIKPMEEKKVLGR